MRVVPIDFPNAEEVGDRENSIASRDNERISQGEMSPVALLLSVEGEGRARSQVRVGHQQIKDRHDTEPTSEGNEQTVLINIRLSVLNQKIGENRFLFLIFATKAIQRYLAAIPKSAKRYT